MVPASWYFQEEDRVCLNYELQRYDANSHWRGKTGTILEFNSNYALVQWDHLSKPQWVDCRYLDLADGDKTELPTL